MEKPFSIPTPDGKRIYGVLHSPATQTHSAVIFVHGLMGHMNEYHHLTVARHLAEKGLTVFRFNQYDESADARHFHETTISMHVNDTKAVIAYARSCDISKIALVGHSLGGPVAIAAANDEISALLLWDPTASPAERVPYWDTHDAEHKLSYLDLQARIILGNAWLEDAKEFPDSFRQAAKLSMPIKIIAAELGGKFEFCKRYSTALQRDHDFVVIPNSGHKFTEEGAIEGLINESDEWLINQLQ